jgi:hypothetical protein
MLLKIRYRPRKHVVECVWNLMAHGNAREGRWRGNWRMEWVVSTLHTTSERGLSSITTADAHTSAASSRLNWRPCRFKWTRPFRRKTKSGFCACAITFQTQSTTQYFSTTVYDTIRVTQKRLSTRLLSIWHTHTHTHTPLLSNGTTFQSNAVGETSQPPICRRRGTDVCAVQKRPRYVGDSAKRRGSRNLRQTRNMTRSHNDDQNEKKEPGNLPSCPVCFNSILRVRKKCYASALWKSPFQYTSILLLAWNISVRTNIGTDNNRIWFASDTLLDRFR